jgi:integrase
MQKVFHAMRALPPNVPDGSPGMTEYLRTRAAESADLAQFMAYSGARMTEAVTWTWEDERPASVMLRGTKTEGSRDREVPQTGALKDLLHRMKRRRQKDGRPLAGRAFLIRQCREALATACKRVGVAPLTHHGLRHFFATTCIESGVDIPTVSRWLGHADGGALAMRVYGHLRQEHSQAAAAKVNFSRGGGL